MICRLEDIRKKEVIDIKTGERLGFIDDAEFDLATGEVRKLLIYGGMRFFGLFGKENDISIECRNIKVIGREVLLVDTDKSNNCTDLPKNEKNSI